MPTEPISSSPQPEPERLELLSATAYEEALAFLALRPYHNAYLLSALRHDPRSLIGQQICVLHRDANGAIDGLVHFDANVVIEAHDDAAAQALARYALSLARPRMIVGPREAAAPYWRALAPSYPPPSLVRERQPLMIVDRSHLRGSRKDAPVRLARADETDAIAANSAQMIESELGYDPRTRRPGFRAGVAGSIERGWWWVLIEDGGLRFMCNVGIATRETAQLQGVWTPPGFRGRGIAARALGAVCDHLLDRFPTLTLYVNDFNTPALALYERLGFREVGAFMTVLL